MSSSSSSSESPESSNLLIHSHFPFVNGKFDKFITSHQFVRPSKQRNMGTQQSYIPAPNFEEDRYHEILNETGMALLKETQNRIAQGDFTKHENTEVLFKALACGTLCGAPVFFDRSFWVKNKNDDKYYTSTCVILRAENWVLTMSGKIHVFDPQDVKGLSYVSSYIAPELQQFPFY